MASRVVVLGGCGAWPEPGRACSGFVLEHAGCLVVIDLGYGTLTRLLALLGSTTGAGVDAVVISHKHPDHMLDLHGLFRARWFGDPGAPPIPLYAADGVVERLQGLEEEDDGEAITDVFDHHLLPRERPYAVGPLRLESRLLPHYVPNAGVRLSADGLVVAYTGDTGPDDGIVELARDADLLIAQASHLHAEVEATGAPPEKRMHLTAYEAGVAAHEAGVGRLLLTHFWPGSDRERFRAEAATAYAGEILLADEGVEILLGESP